MGQATYNRRIMDSVYLHLHHVARLQDSETNPTWFVYLTLIPHGSGDKFVAIGVDATIDCGGNCVTAGAYKFGRWRKLELGTVNVTWDGDVDPTVYTNRIYDFVN